MRIVDLKTIHIVRKGNTNTICGMKLEDILKYKWIHPFETYKKKLIIHNKLDMPTCINCINILKLYGIEIVKEYTD